MTDKLIGVFALAVLGGFLGILLSFVPRVDLMAVVALCFGLAAADLFLTLKRGK
ncbi:MAG: hypothetical protein COW75_03565 [Rhodobacterales bacterium CG18_big_fil_WC_8_21_14_2_50_71_9]|nr:MAG: hypothetical protein COW75_03565 [Rhodobacterales bacterium CG18_big_fil_WC_8_21_14_2_50_71_9]